jgi:ornithine cyclodeaminase
MTVEVARDAAEVVRRTSLVAFATTATVPYVRDPSLLSPESTVLHVSLRDLSPEVILHSDNVVDDVDHVCRAQTSVHLAEQLKGSRSFIRTTLSDVISDAAPPRLEGSPVVFSPFGLGVLDLAVGRLVLTAASTTGRGHRIPAFCPPPWSTDSPPEPGSTGNPPAAVSAGA